MQFRTAVPPLRWTLRFRPRRLELLVFVFAFLPVAFAETPPSADFAIETWQTDNGLPQNSVTSVFQSSDGYIYAGTYNGMARFDGVRFVVSDSVNKPALKNSRVTSLYQDKTGVIWIGHESGDVSWLADGVFHSLDPGTNWPAGEIVGFGSDDEGDVWALNHAGNLGRLRDGKILPPLPSSISTQPGTPRLVEAENGLWMTFRGIAGFLQHGELHPFRFDSTSETAYFESTCTSHDGGLWVAGERRLRKWTGGPNGKWTADLGAFPWDEAFITTMLETHDGKLLVGTLDSGIYVFVPGSPVSHWSHTNGLPHDWIRSMAEDREGNVWLGTGGGGLCVLRPRKVWMFNPPDVWQDRLVQSVAHGMGDSVWAGTEGAGLYEFANEQWTHFASSQGLSNLFVWSVLPDSHGGVWSGTWGGGLFHKTGSRFELAAGPEIFLDLPTTAMMEGGHGEILLGTMSGLLRFQDGKYEWLWRGEHADIRALAQAPDGTIWFGMNSGSGLGCWKNGDTKILRKKDGLASNFVLSLYLDSEGTLWIGTLDNGLCRLKNGKFSTIGSRSGLPSDVICGIADDGSDCFWISSQSGIFRVSKLELNACADGQTVGVHCLVYGRCEGLATLACSGGFQPSFCRSADGRIWFPTSKGLAVVNPRLVSRNTIIPPVWIEEALADNKPVPIQRGKGQADSLVVQPGQLQVGIHFTALSFTSPERVQFKYKLEPLEKDWLKAAAGLREVSYSYLQPGDYAFHVIACNSDGLWNEEGAAIKVTVLPQIWQTWWFKTFAWLCTVFLVVGTVLLIARRRVELKLERLERQRALDRERTRIAKDIHDDLGASLTQITMLSQTAIHQLEKPEQAAQHLRQIFGAARASTRALDEIVWAVNPRHDSLESVATYIVKFAQDFLGPTGVRCRLEMPLQLPPRTLTAELRHNLFLAYKEALNNVIKHAEAREVRISLTLSDDGFALGVADDGRGFDFQKVSSGPSLDRLGGNGLENMRRRLEEIGGLFEIESVPGGGTRVKFQIKIRGGTNGLVIRTHDVKMQDSV
jgi:signal transduction histidine kinase/ligand-binding sensor domain-containing protein